MEVRDAKEGKMEFDGWITLSLPLRVWIIAQNWKISVETKEWLIFLCQFWAKYYLNQAFWGFQRKQGCRSSRVEPQVRQNRSTDSRVVQQSPQENSKKSYHLDLNQNVPKNWLGYPLNPWLCTNLKPKWATKSPSLNHPSLQGFFLFFFKLIFFWYYLL